MQWGNPVRAAAANVPLPTRGSDFRSVLARSGSAVEEKEVVINLNADETRARWQHHTLEVEQMDKQLRMPNELKPPSLDAGADQQIRLLTDCTLCNAKRHTHTPGKRAYRLVRWHSPFRTTVPCGAGQGNLTVPDRAGFRACATTDP